MHCFNSHFVYASLQLYRKRKISSLSKTLSRSRASVQIFTYIYSEVQIHKGLCYIRVAAGRYEQKYFSSASMVEYLKPQSAFFFPIQFGGLWHGVSFASGFKDELEFAADNSSISFFFSYQYKVGISAFPQFTHDMPT